MNLLIAHVGFFVDHSNKKQYSQHCGPLVDCSTVMHSRRQKPTGILNNEVTLANWLSGLDTPAPVPGQKHLHLWRLQLMKRPADRTNKCCQLCVRLTNQLTTLVVVYTMDEVVDPGVLNKAIGEWYSSYDTVMTVSTTTVSTVSTTNLMQ